MLPGVPVHESRCTEDTAIDPKDRRKVSISATPEGRAAAEQSMKKYDEIWDEILERFGEDNMKNLIELIQSLDELYAAMGKK